MENPNELIRKKCDAAGYTRADIAAHVGVSKHTVDNWFSAGRVIPPAKVRAIEELLQGGTRRAVSYDSVMAYAVRLTPAEYQQLCEMTGKANMSASEVEKAVRDLLQRTWDDLAATVPDVVEEPEPPTVMPGPSAFPGAYVPAARSGPHGPQC